MKVYTMNIISKARRKCAFLILLLCIMTPTDVVAQELIRFQPYLGGGAGLSNQQLKSNLCHRGTDPVSINKLSTKS